MRVSSNFTITDKKEAALELLQPYDGFIAKGFITDGGR